MLLIIKPAKNARPPQNPNFKEDSRVKDIRFVLVDMSFKQLLDCDYNDETYDAITKFLT